MRLKEKTSIFSLMFCSPINMIYGFPKSFAHGTIESVFSVLAFKERLKIAPLAFSFLVRENLGCGWIFGTSHGVEDTPRMLKENKLNGCSTVPTGKDPVPTSIFLHCVFVHNTRNNYHHCSINLFVARDISWRGPQLYSWSFCEIMWQGFPL